MKHTTILWRGLAAGILLLAAGCGGNTHDSTLVQDRFTAFDTSRWAVESEAGSPATAAYVSGGALVLDAQLGLTVWYKKRLSGHYAIEYTRTVLVEGQPHDRLSDNNMFWLAQLDDAAPFTRSGVLADYDAVPMYYAGIGGNTNTTTRFRRYDGTGARILLQEYLTAPYLLVANHPYKIRIVVDGAGTSVSVDGQQYFSAAADVTGGGYFGFRTTQSRQKIENFSVTELP
jgi:hypothetical protein